MRDVLAVLRTPEGAIGGGVLILMVAAALLAPVLAPGDPLAIVGRPLRLPLADPRFPLGTDRLGRDVLTGLLHGARSTLGTGAAVMAAALLLGGAVGTIAGYLGGAADEVLMRIADAVQTVPGFVLALAIVSVAGPTQPAILLALTAGAWTGPARVVRAEVMALRSRPFVDASRLLGRHPLAIAFGGVLPNALGPLLALAPIVVAGAMLSEAALTFLGLGDPNVATWGAMIAEGRAVLRTAPHVIVAPGLAVAVAVLAVSLLGEGMQRAAARRT
jgi:peptide/nickel transport system permease protein